MNLRDLTYLTAMADTLHFGRAALACHVSQPTLSMQLKKLEETLGVALFERNNKRVMLTRAGEAMAVRARRILAEAQAMRDEAKSARDPFAGELRLGAFPTLAPYALPHIMPDIKNRFPMLNVLLVEEKTALLLEMLETGALDAALIAMPVEAPQLASRLLFTEPFRLAVPAEHRLADSNAVTEAMLAHENLLLLDEGHCLRDQALQFCQTIGAGESRHFRATSLETLRQMVASGSAVTLMPGLAASGYESRIRYLPFTPPRVPARSIGLYWRVISARAQLFEALADCIAQTIGTILAKK